MLFLIRRPVTLRTREKPIPTLALHPLLRVARCPNPHFILVRTVYLLLGSALRGQSVVRAHARLTAKVGTRPMQSDALATSSPSWNDTPLVCPIRIKVSRLCREHAVESTVIQFPWQTQLPLV